MTLRGDKAGEPVEQEAGPIATDPLFGATRKRADRPRALEVHSWRPWPFTQGDQVLERSESCLDRPSGPRGVRKTVKEFTERGCGLEIGRCAPRSAEVDRRHVDEFTDADSGLQPKDAFLGTCAAAESVMTGLRALIQALCQGMRSSERRR